MHLQKFSVLHIYTVQLYHYTSVHRARTSTSTTVVNTPGEQVCVDCIATYSKGFICSGGSGTLHLFEKTDDLYIYRKARTVSVWIDPNSNLVATTGADSVPNDILSMTLSPSEENVVCSTRTQQLYNLTLSAADLQGQVRSAQLSLFSI